MEYADYSLRKFVGTLSSDNPTPGGGSAAGVNGALAASLLLMVIRVTNQSSELESYEDLLEAKKEKALELIDEDAESFNQVMEAFRLPKATEEERKKRGEQIQSSFKAAAAKPLEMMELSVEIAEIAVEVTKKGNPNAVTDAAAGAIAAKAAADTAYYNVMINLESIADEKFVERVGSKAQRLKEKAAKKKSRVLSTTEDNIEILGRDWHE